MGLPTTASPGFVGTYGNWARTGPTVGPGAFYAHWLGDATKENDYLAYMLAFNRTSIRIYDLQTLDTGSNFTAAGILMLRNFILKARTVYGMTELIGVRNIFGADDGINGTSAMACIINYNAAVTANERFDYGNIENEPWNFPNNPTSPGGTVSSTGVTVTGVGTSFLTATAVRRFIRVAGQYRQVINIANNGSLTIDRAFSPAIPAGSTWQDYNTVTNLTSRFNFTVDYDTYIFRAGLCAAMLTGAGKKVELYISRNSANSFLQQLTSICPAAAGRILITQFQVTPRESYDQNALIQIASAGIPFNFAYLVSVESATFHAGCDDPADCAGSPDAASNFAGYFVEGKDSAGVPTYLAKSDQDVWDYLTKAAPYVNTPSPYNLGTGANKSLNEETDALLVANATCEGIVYFEQGIIRQLVMVPPDPLSATETHTDVTVNGASDGTITIAPTGGTGPNTYLWGDGPVTQNRTGLPPGTYSVVITDSLLATFTINNIVITEPAVSGTLVADLIITNVVCNGSSTGSINPQITGGSGSYYYEWSQLGIVISNDAILTGVPAGTYDLYVLDTVSTNTFTQNGIIISESTPIVITATPTYNSPCTGTNKDLVIAVSGGPTNVYIVELIHTVLGSMGFGLLYTNLPPGNYIARVKCVYGGAPTAYCLQELAFEIFSCLVVTGRVTNVRCVGSNTGAIQLNVTGGSGTVTYLWNTGDAVDNIVNQFAGVYSCDITDTVTGEIVTVPFTITEPSVLLSGSLAPVNPSIAGASNGWMSANGIGGYGFYSYQWNDPLAQTTQVATNLSAGSYTCVITDSGGCTVTLTATLSDPVSTVLIPADDLTKYVTDFATRLENIKCCIGLLTKKMATAKRIGDNCYDCLKFKRTVLEMVYESLSRFTYSRTVTAAVNAISGELDTADNPAIDVPTYTKWTLSVDGNVIVVVEGYYTTIYAGILAAITTAINTDGRFVASNILPNIGLKITDNGSQGAFLNGKSVTLDQDYTSLTVNPTLVQAVPPTTGSCIPSAYDPTRKLTYISDINNNVVYVYDINDVLVATINVGQYPAAMVYRPDADLVMVFCMSDNTCHKIRNITNLGNFAISTFMMDAGLAVYDPSTNKVVVAETFSAGAPLNVYMYTAGDVETVVPLPVAGAYTICYNPNLFRIMLLPKNAGQPRQLNTGTGVITNFALTYPIGVTNIYSIIYVQDGIIDNLFVMSNLGIHQYQFGGGFVQTYTGISGFTMVYNQPSKLIICIASSALRALDLSTGVVVVPNTPVYSMPTLAYTGISRGTTAGRNTVVFAAYYFGGSGPNIGYVIEIEKVSTQLATVMTGGVDSFNTFTFDNCLPNSDYDWLLLLASEICCNEGCGCCG